MIFHETHTKALTSPAATVNATPTESSCRDVLFGHRMTGGMGYVLFALSAIDVAL